MKRILVQKISMKSIVFQIFFSLLLMLICAYYILVFADMNPYLILILNKVPFYIFASFCFIPLSAYFCITSINNYLDLIKQERAVTLNDDI